MQRRTCSFQSPSDQHRVLGARRAFHRGILQRLRCSACSRSSIAHLQRATAKDIWNSPCETARGCKHESAQHGEVPRRLAHLCVNTSRSRPLTTDSREGSLRCGAARCVDAEDLGTESQFRIGWPRCGRLVTTWAVDMQSLQTGRHSLKAATGTSPPSGRLRPPSGGPGGVPASHRGRDAMTWPQRLQVPKTVLKGPAFK